MPATVGRTKLPGSSRPGLLTLVPPGTPIRWQIEGGLEALSIHLTEDRVAALLGEGEGAHPRFEFAFTDRFLSESMLELRDELLSPKERGTLYADALGDAVTLHLLRKHSAGSALLAPRPGGLSRRSLRRVLERIEASLEMGVSIAELAREVDLGRSQLQSAFRVSTGTSPHRWLSKRRIEEACRLLAATDEPLAEIAYRCGFPSQAHFAERFRRAMGTTPSAHRRASA